MQKNSSRKIPSRYLQKRKLARVGVVAQRQAPSSLGPRTARGQLNDRGRISPKKHCYLRHCAVPDQIDRFSLSQNPRQTWLMLQKLGIPTAYWCTVLSFRLFGPPIPLLQTRVAPPATCDLFCCSLPLYAPPPPENVPPPPFAVRTTYSCSLRQSITRSSSTWPWTVGCT